MEARDIVFSAHAIFRFFERHLTEDFEKINNSLKKRGVKIDDGTFAEYVRSTPKYQRRLDRALVHAVPRVLYPLKTLKYEKKNDGIPTNFILHACDPKMVFVVRDNLVITVFPYDPTDFSTYDPNIFNDPNVRKIKHYKF